MKEDKLICTCMDVYKSTIVKAIQEKGLTTVEDVGSATEAGTVCGQCQEEIQQILDQIVDQ